MKTTWLSVPLRARRGSRAAPRARPTAILRPGDRGDVAERRALGLGGGGALRPLGVQVAEPRRGTRRSGSARSRFGHQRLDRRRPRARPRIAEQPPEDERLAAPRPCPTGRRAGRARCSRSSIAARTACENGLPRSTSVSTKPSVPDRQPSIVEHAVARLDQLAVGVDDRAARRRRWPRSACGGHGRRDRAARAPRSSARGRRAAACWRARRPCRRRAPRAASRRRVVGGEVDQDRSRRARAAR